MSYQFPPDTADMVQQQIAAGYFENEDDVLRFALGQMPSEDENVRSIQEAIDLMNAGDMGRPSEEVFAEMREKYGISEDL
jgi:Arc/MetJ-type ribon-helix-helix transcriptional regulator